MIIKKEYITAIQGGVTGILSLMVMHCMNTGILGTQINGNG